MSTTCWREVRYCTSGLLERRRQVVHLSSDARAAETSSLDQRDLAPVLSRRDKIRRVMRRAGIPDAVAAPARGRWPRRCGRACRRPCGRSPTRSPRRRRPSPPSSDAKFKRDVRTAVQVALERFLDLVGTDEPALPPPVREVFVALGAAEAREDRGPEALLAALRTASRLMLRTASRGPGRGAAGRRRARSSTCPTRSRAYVDELAAASTDGFALQVREQAGDPDRCRADATGSRACWRPPCWRRRGPRGARARVTSSTRTRSLPSRGRSRPTMAAAPGAEVRRAGRTMATARRSPSQSQHGTRAGARDVDPDCSAAERRVAAPAHRRPGRPDRGRRSAVAGGRSRAARAVQRARAAPPDELARRPRLSARYDGRTLPLRSTKAESQRLPFFLAGGAERGRWTTGLGDLVDALDGLGLLGLGVLAAAAAAVGRLQAQDAAGLGQAPGCRPWPGAGVGVDVVRVASLASL